MVWLSEVQKYGVGFTAGGVFFFLLGILTFFDSALLALGNVRDYSQPSSPNWSFMCVLTSALRSPVVIRHRCCTDHWSAKDRCVLYTINKDSGNNLLCTGDCPHFDEMVVCGIHRWSHRNTATLWRLLRSYYHVPQKYANHRTDTIKPIHRTSKFCHLVLQFWFIDVY